MVYFERRENDVLEVAFKLGPGASCLKRGACGIPDRKYREDPELGEL